MSRDPRYDPLPSDPIERIERFARDLAWGALNEKWGVTFMIPYHQFDDGTRTEEFNQESAELYNYLAKMWHTNRQPTTIRQHVYVCTCVK